MSVSECKNGNKDKTEHSKDGFLPFNATHTTLQFNFSAICHIHGVLFVYFSVSDLEGGSSSGGGPVNTPMW